MRPVDYVRDQGFALRLSPPGSPPEVQSHTGATAPFPSFTLHLSRAAEEDRENLFQVLQGHVAQDLEALVTV